MISSCLYASAKKTHRACSGRPLRMVGGNLKSNHWGSRSILGSSRSEEARRKEVALSQLGMTLASIKGTTEKIRSVQGAIPMAPTPLQCFTQACRFPRTPRLKTHWRHKLPFVLATHFGLEELVLFNSLQR